MGMPVWCSEENKGYTPCSHENQHEENEIIPVSLQARTINKSSDRSILCGDNQSVHEHDEHTLESSSIKIMVHFLREKVQAVIVVKKLILAMRQNQLRGPNRN